jgi:hypothetical protein
VIYPYKHLLTLFSITFSDERQTMETQNSYSAERKPYSHPKVRGTSVISIRRSEKTGKFLDYPFWDQQLTQLSIYLNSLN